MAPGQEPGGRLQSSGLVLLAPALLPPPLTSQQLPSLLHPRAPSSATRSAAPRPVPCGRCLLAPAPFAATLLLLQALPSSRCHRTPPAHLAPTQNSRSSRPLAPFPRVGLPVRTGHWGTGHPWWPHCAHPQSMELGKMRSRPTVCTGGACQLPRAQLCWHTCCAQAAHVCSPHRPACECTRAHGCREV